MSNSIRVLVVDDQELFREGLVTLLSTFPDFCVVGQAENGERALAVTQACLPQVVLMDLRMPVLDGVRATRRFRAEHPHVKVLVLTTFDDDESVFDALRAGALGYLLKDASAGQLAEAVRQAARGESSLTPRIATRLVQHVASQSEPPRSSQVATLGELTSRERDVLAMLGRGATNKDIARSLNVAEGTVKNHVTSVFTKLGVSDRLKAALVARELGLGH
jgi:DNA-binding NarL/FixJ family response regulator